MKKTLINVAVIILLVCLLGCNLEKSFEVSDSAEKHSFNKNNLLSLISITVDTDKVIYKFSYNSEICKKLDSGDYICGIIDENGILNIYDDWSYQKKGNKGYLCIECEDTDRIKEEMIILKNDYSGKYYEIIGFDSPRLLMLNDRTTNEHYEVNYEQDYDLEKRKWKEIHESVIDDPNTVDV